MADPAGLGSNKMDNKEDLFYSDAKDYWAKVNPTVDGMLGGFAKISPTDISGSKEFLRPYLKNFGGSVTPVHALDCGAGIGRITKRLLLPIFETVDMVEQDQTFCNKARDFIGPEARRVTSIFCCGLQDFVPKEIFYDVIWCQWVLGHLQDGDLIAFFSRCRKSLKPGGILVVKENTASEGPTFFDDKDSSYTRTLNELKDCMLKADMTILAQQKQKGFPKDLLSVYMFALH